MRFFFIQRTYTITLARTEWNIGKWMFCIASKIILNKSIWIEFFWVAEVPSIAMQRIDQNV